MNVIDRYLPTMTAKNMFYRYTLIELVRRGYKRQTAKKIMLDTNIVDRAMKDPIIFFHYAPDQWADFVESNYGEGE